MTDAEDGVPQKEGGGELSKKAQKKALKEAEKKLKRMELEEQERKRKEQADANDISKDKYGNKAPQGSKDYTPLKQKRSAFSDLTTITPGEEIAFRARILSSRSQSAKLAFLLLQDYQHLRQTIQVVVAASDTVSRQLVKFAASIPPQSLLDCVGIVREADQEVKSATISNRELHATEVWVIEQAKAQLPIQLEDSQSSIPSFEGESTSTGRATVGLSTRLDNRVLDLRAPVNQDIFDVHAGVEILFTEFLMARNFVPIRTPKLLGAPSEGGSNVFEVTYFERKAYLAQSPQLYKQMAIASGRSRVFEIADVFRAENSNTSRHLTEYSSLDLEMVFEENYLEVLHFIRDLTLHILHGLQERYKVETERVRQIYPIQPFLIPAKPEDVPILDFAEGVKLLAEAGIHLDENDDINSTQEKQLGDIVKKKYNTDFYILKEYPLDVRAFYSMPSATQPGKSHSYDFMLRGQEVLSGAQRIHNHALLRSEMKRRGLDPDGPGLKDYVECFSYGVPPHAGGAFGLERIVCNWLGLPNVRLGSMFPRDPGRLVP